MEVKTLNKTQEAIRKISPELKHFIYDLFQQSISETIRDGALPPTDTNYMTPDILSVAKHHKKVCNSANYANLSCTDQKIFNLYRASLSNIIVHRTVTALMTSFMEKFVDYLMWVTIWYNQHCPADKKISADIIVNRKGLTPELTKALLKNVNIITDNNSLFSLQPAIIRDLFRGTFITAKNDIDNLKNFIRIVIAILTNPISVEYNEFYSWVKNCPKTFGGMRIPKEDLLEFQKYSFVCEHERNYIDNPKGLYRAWQVTIVISDAPDYKSGLRGKMFEFKFYTFDMHETATIGKASQDEYKKEVYEFMEEVFPIANYTGGIEFYATGLDRNGLTKARDFYSRNVNENVIPDTSQ